MSDELLDLQLRLLFLRHGREEVLNAIARLSDASPADIDMQLKQLEQKKDTRRKTEQRSIVALVDADYSQHSDIVAVLREIAVKFENKQFLPHLRDVQRFLDRIGAGRSTYKSRAVAGQALLRALAQLNREDLLRIVERSRVGPEGDYAILSRAIMTARSGGNE